MASTTRTTDLPPLSSIGQTFRSVALLEAVSWLGLLVGMFLKHILDATDAVVALFGRVHGGIVLVYVVVTIVAARTHRWPVGRLVIGLLAAVPPFATVFFERLAHREGLLSDEPTERATA